MPYLIGSIISNLLFAQIYKLATQRGQDVDWVSAVSFISATSVLLVMRGPQRGRVAWSTIGLGVAFGLTAGIAQLTYFRAVPYGRVSVSWTIVQLAMLVAVLVGILAWKELPSLWQGVAIAGGVVAVFLLGDVELHQVQQPRQWARWVGLTYVLSGLALITLKAHTALQPDHSDVPFLLSGYVVMALVSLPLVRGRWPTRQEVGTGVVRGLALLSMQFLLLRATALLPTYLVFPLYSTANVLSNAGLAVLVWGERMQTRTLLGMLLALAAMIVLNL